MRRTFTLQLQVTAEVTPDGYTAEDLAADIRDMTFTAVTEETPLDVIVMALTAAPEDAPEDTPAPIVPARVCYGQGGTGDPRCGRAYGHSGPCDWTD